MQVPADELTQPSETAEPATPAHQCLHCKLELGMIEVQPRLSWKEVFNEGNYAPTSYCLLLHIACSRGPPQHKLPISAELST
ncbi:MAG TPA: hypothetical protein DDW52_28220 [Planctomycetaceae bacterium]|nr:hypothetical protein [Planctomycetaceae bacterium]